MLQQLDIRSSYQSSLPSAIQESSPIDNQERHVRFTLSAQVERTRIMQISAK